MNFENTETLSILWIPPFEASLPSHRSVTPTLLMENPVDRMIRLMAIAAGVVSLLVYAIFHLV